MRSHWTTSTVATSAPMCPNSHSISPYEIHPVYIHTSKFFLIPKPTIEEPEEMSIPKQLEELKLGSEKGTPVRSIRTTPLPQSQSAFLSMPPEIIHRIICVAAEDGLQLIGHAARTCRQLHHFIYNNADQSLWRDAFLTNFDDPREACAFVAPRSEFNWRKRVQDIAFVQRKLKESEEPFDDLEEHIDRIASTLLDLYLDLPAPNDGEEPRNSEILNDCISSDAFLYIMRHLSTHESRPILRQLKDQPGNPNRRPLRQAYNASLSRLELLYPVFLRDSAEDDREYRGNMRFTSYWSSNYCDSNDRGPFKTDGTVDWNLVNALACVMISNGRDLLSMGEEGWYGSSVPIHNDIEEMRHHGWSRPRELEPDAIWDWAGVQGQWCGTYAFLDYADWISLNEPRLVLLRRALNELDLTTYNEAVGDLMHLNLVLEREEDVDPELPSLISNLPTSSLLPPLYFKGSHATEGPTAFGNNIPNARFVRGVVRLTTDDPPQVRWTMIIRYGGEDRWRLECVQPGGRLSKRGFFGAWTDAQRGQLSPNGPVWYWKQ